MCRNIKKLRIPDRSPTEEEIALAALQFVRKVSGYQKPSLSNRAAFDAAVEEIAAATRRLLTALESSGRSQVVIEAARKQAASWEPRAVDTFPE